jgi:alpha-beta hydrolase superfamily lysophospholipase
LTYNQYLLTTTSSHKSAFQRKMLNYFKWIFWIFIVQFLLFNISAALYAYKFTKVYDAPIAGSVSGQTNVLNKTWRFFSGPLQRKMLSSPSPVFKYKTITFHTKNKLSLEAWFAQPDIASKGTVILFHGWLSNKSILLPEASEFIFQGYSVLLVDFRAHGNSQGHVTTIGVNEAEEVKLAWDFIKTKGEKNIILYGISMGAVAIAKAVGEFSLSPSGLILEMPFESMQSIIQGKARAQGFQNFVIKPFSFFVTFWMGVERGISALQHKTANYVSKINCPVLLQWGANDEYVLRNETEKIFNAIASKNKKIVVYENAGHESLLYNDPHQWRIETERFLKNINSGLPL